ncbi:vitelline membrane protein Vm26Aa [Drosophila busckii]|uniref:vitelline membrane protein Vm26Aa n=1 Tax=Drosophila busckii TaxID=30019 RepID=UPI001432B7C4|nr:vitelline membrane protein Vm26Aa [Drosophila busckii]
MKFLVCFAIIAFAANALANPTGSVAVANQESEAEGAQAQAYGDLTRLRKSAYGASSGGYGAQSVPAPPCPKNYLFSCQPNLAPVPCAAPAASYGSAGAYSAPVPTYAVPQQQQYYGYAPQAYGYQY